MSISRFGFIVSFTAYLGLLFAEYLRPGFVSNAMNVHVVWVVMAAWIIGEWAMGKMGNGQVNQDAQFAQASRLPNLPLLFIGLLLALIIWHIGSIFGDMRLFFALAVGILPSILL